MTARAAGTNISGQQDSRSFFDLFRTGKPKEKSGETRITREPEKIAAL
jgi:hypothetical protein